MGTDRELTVLQTAFLYGGLGPVFVVGIFAAARYWRLRIPDLFSV